MESVRRSAGILIRKPRRQQELHNARKEFQHHGVPMKDAMNKKRQENGRHRGRVLVPLGLAMILAVAGVAWRGDATARLASAKTSAVEDLRTAARGGNTSASLALVQHLLARNDPRSPMRPVYEALPWIDRDWGSDTFQRTDFMETFYERECWRPGLEWYWICNQGE